MKVANIIVAHKNPNQLKRFVCQYNEEQFHHFIHVDGRCRAGDFAEVAKLPGVTMLPRRRKLVWAGYGFVQVTLDALYAIRKRPEKYFYVNLMSGMDFPIKPTHDFYEYLLASYPDRKEFFEILDLGVWPGAHRYERYHLTGWTIKGRYFTERIINRFMEKRAFYGGQLVPYGRAAWFTATEDFIDYGLKFVEQHPDYLSFLKTVWCPDEFIWNTILMNSSFKDRLGPHYLRHIDWSEGNASPKVFRKSDLEALKTTPAFIARKFDETIDNEILTSIEELNGALHENRLHV